FYGDSLLVEYPTGSGNRVTLGKFADEIEGRLTRIFQANPDGSRPFNDGNALYETRAEFKDLVLFHEYFHGDSGAGLGASHQTGWTALVAEFLK
ncbi:MAG: glucosidase, partial [Verrucomicrobiota bacterium]